MTALAISGTGVYTPPNLVTNEELCEAFNAYVRGENERNREAIEAGDAEPLAESSPEFILKASGIKQRYTFDKAGVLNPDQMRPYVPDRSDDELSIQAEWATAAARKALEAAGRVGEDLDLVILAGANIQRPYPAVAIEVQAELGARGYAYDMLAGCSSATFPIQLACDAIRSGSARRALVVIPEIMSGHANFKDRDSHFIFGDAAAALVIEPLEEAKAGSWEIISTRCKSKFSSNIRNNGGFLNRCDPEHQFDKDKLFYQKGRRVFKDVVPLAAEFITEHIRSHELEPQSIGRFWLHQANCNLNNLVIKRILGEVPEPERAPLVLDRYGNTAAAGSIIAFHHHRDDLAGGTWGVVCSFGAGYSIGSVVVRRA